MTYLESGEGRSDMRKKGFSLGIILALFVGCLSYGFMPERQIQAEENTGNANAASGSAVAAGAANEEARLFLPGKVKGLKVKKSHKKFTVTWKKTAGASGYQVYTKVFVRGIKTKYSKVRTMKGRKYKRGMLVRGMKYGFKVRALKKVKGKTVYGPFVTITKRY